MERTSWAAALCSAPGGHELQRYPLPGRRRGFPDLAETAAADRQVQAVARVWFRAGLEVPGLSHGASGLPGRFGRVGGQGREKASMLSSIIRGREAGKTRIPRGFAPR